MNVRPALRLCAGLLGLLSSGCLGAPAGPLPESYEPEPSAPAWSGRPPSWGKRGDIEEWLAGEGPSAYPDYVREAKLQLAEGRLALARKESGSLPPQVLALRLSVAEADFHKVLAREDLTVAQKLRAERGLAELRGLGKGVKEAPVAAAAPLDLAIQPRSGWGAASALPARLTRATGRWTRVTVHHSAKYSHELGGSSAASAIRDIQRVHMRDEGYGDIGYHFLIDPTGRVWQGRTLEWQGAHSGGDNNIGNVGVCLLGDFDHERPDPRALASLDKLVSALCERHGIKRSRVYGHQELRPTECPGETLMAWVRRYASSAPAGAGQSSRTSSTAVPSARQ